MVWRSRCWPTLVAILTVSCLLSLCDGQQIRNDTPVFHVIRVSSNDPNLFTDVELVLLLLRPYTLLFRDRVLCVAGGVALPMTMYGANLQYVTTVYAVAYPPSVDDDECHMAATNHSAVSTRLLAEALYTDFTIKLPMKQDQMYQFCFEYAPVVDDDFVESSRFIAASSESRVLIKCKARRPEANLMPIWLQIICVLLLLILAALFSGLTLGLMSLDPSELRMIIRSGTKAERKYASIILPFRNRGNYLLCSLLLGNVCVCSGVSILMDNLTGSGVVALCASTLGIVVFGEIIPQAVCNREGLKIGAYTIWLTKVLMLVCFPIAYPVSKLLDCILGEEMGTTYTRDRLIELIRLGCKTDGGVNMDEFRIVTGALEYTRKTVGEVLTKAENVFMLPSETVLNAKKISEIMHTGYTRIPVYEKDRNNVVSLLNVKDLALLDPDDNFTVRTLCSYYEHPIGFVTENTRLAPMLDEFRKGNYHMAIVHKGGDEWNKAQVAGVVTLEDIIEEIIQAEINDETDVITDNVNRQRRHSTAEHTNKGLAHFLNAPDKAPITPQMLLASTQYMCAQMPNACGQMNAYSASTLQRLVMNGVRKWTPGPAMDNDGAEPLVLYANNVPSNRFILILEGRVHVTIGQEVLENVCQLMQPLNERKTSSLPNVHNVYTITESHEEGQPPVETVFTPDYTARARQDIMFVEITATDYMTAYRTAVLHAHHAEHTKEHPLDIVDTTHKKCADNDTSSTHTVPTANHMKKRHSINPLENLRIRPARNRTNSITPVDGNL